MSMLGVIATKAPIVTTFDVQALRTATAEVYETYNWYAATYVEQPALAALRKAFIAAVRQAQTPKACVVAPFGYGKTATAIGLWKACGAAGLLAVPPISCKSFTDLAQGIYDSLVFVLPECRKEIEIAHDTFLASSASTMAQRDERLFGIPFDQAAAAIRDKLERGYLDFEDVSINLLAFLEQATELAIGAGYGGLVVMLDEFQQLLGNANKGVLVALRQLVWGLRTRQLPLGILFTMDTDTERTLADRAGDILHRIKDDGLYLDIRHIYDREFPARLWHQYSAVFNLSSAAQKAIDKPALDALGQLCERDDLSNGPRTVINVLQRAALQYEAGSATGYTPIHLVDDLLQGDVRFDGDRSVLPTLVAELLNFPYFQSSPERTRALKLMAAFPRGCAAEVAYGYQLGAAWQEINDDLRGEIVTELEEGLALIELQRVARPTNRLNILLRRYWMQITDQQLFAEDAPRAFTTLVLPLLFPAKVHDLNGWAGLADVQLSSQGGYSGVLEGTFSSKFPLRRLAVTIVAGALATEPPALANDNDADFVISFYLDVDPSAKSSMTVSHSGESVNVHLAIARPADEGLKGGLAWIEHYLSPQPISAAVVLSLLRYLTRENISTLPARDLTRIEDTIARLREWLLAELFPPTLFANTQFSVTQAGQGALKEFFYLLAAHRWSSYNSLATQPQWASLLKSYEEALNQVPPLIKLGLAPLTSTKADVARSFGQNYHAGFESTVRQYNNLLHLELWQGDNATVRFSAHAAELWIAEAARTTGAVAHKTVYNQLRAYGFAAAEANALIHLACTRGLVRLQTDQLIPPSIHASTTLLLRAQTLLARGRALPTLPDGIATTLATLINNPDSDPTRVQWDLDQIEERLAALETQFHADAYARWTATQADLLNNHSLLAAVLPSPTTGPLANQLATLNKLLEADRLQLMHTAEQLAAVPFPGAPVEVAALLHNLTGWNEQAKFYVRWNDFARHQQQMAQVLARIQSTEPGVAVLRVATDKLVKDARALLAQEGIAGLKGVDTLVARLTLVESEYPHIETARREAYDQLANRLSSELIELFSLTAMPVFPPYNPNNDETSFHELFQAAVVLVGRFLALLNHQLDENRGVDQSKVSISKLRAELQQAAQRAQDTQWLIDAQSGQVSKPARKAITSLLARYFRSLSEATGYSTIQRALFSTLSRSCAAPADLSQLLAPNADASTEAEVLRELLQLQREGLIQITITLQA